MSSADPNAIPIEQLRTDQATRVHIPAYNVLRFAREKNLVIDPACSYRGDMDGFWNVRNILFITLKKKKTSSLLHILVYTERIGNQMSCCICTGCHNDALSHLLVMHRLCVLHLMSSHVRGGGM